MGFCSNLGAEAAEYYVRSCQDGEVVPVEVVKKILGKLRFEFVWAGDKNGGLKELFVQGMWSPNNMVHRENA